MESNLVTGAKGFIGSRVLTFSSGTSYDLIDGLDILDKNQLEMATQDNVNQIYHLAAKISVPESIEKPVEYFKTNVGGTKNIVELATKRNAKIVFSSSAAVYGATDGPVSENTPVSALSPYAQNKINGEQLLRDSGMPHVALRYFNVYGPGQSLSYAGVISHFIAKALVHEPITIHGDGSQTRDFIYVDDVAHANIAAMNHKNTEFEAFNIATGQSISILELAKLIISLTNSQSQITNEQSRKGDIAHSLADISKTSQILGWKAEISLSDGLKRTIDWFAAKN